MDIESNWDTKIFDGKKSFVLTTTNVYGGRNLFLGYSFIVVGVLSFLSGILFGLKLFKKKKMKVDIRGDQELNSLVNGQNYDS